jgi:glycosyltransferase involved in cell wall biosynthesis
MKILILSPYPRGTAPSQRFRYEHYLPYLDKATFDYDYHSFWSDEAWAILYKPGHKLTKVMHTLSGFWRRFLLLFSLRQYDYVFVHREASPIGPPVFEFLISKVMGKRLVYDFDDAIWLPNTSDHNKLAAIVKWHGKVRNICAWAYKVSCGNAYLADFARQYNANVVLLPTVVNTETQHNRVKDQRVGRLSIGWTGTHSTLHYLEEIYPVIRQLEQSFDFDFIVIADKAPEVSLKSLQFVPWQEASEIDDLLRLNIGIMPLSDDAWAKGKCGFKAIQYMALGIPAVASPVGVNSTIIQDGQNGMLCSTPDDWYKALSTLLENTEKRQTLGQAARESIIQGYSVASSQAIFEHLFR